MPDNLSEKSNPCDFPLVSIVIPTRNRSALLVRALESVLTQEYRHLEVIVVDDASDDGTPALIDCYRGKFPIFKHIRNEARRGGAESRNIGVQKASGKYIAFLDDDDEWLPRKISAQVKILEDDPDMGASSCWYNRVSNNGSCMVRLMPGTTFDLMLWENFMGSFSFCMVRNDIAKAVLLDPTLSSSQDWQFWLGLAMVTRIHIVEDYLVNYYDHSEARISNSYDMKLLGLRKMYFKYKDYMNERCRIYWLTYLTLYKLFKGRRYKKKILQKILQLIKKSYFLQYKSARFVVKRILLTQLCKALHINRYNAVCSIYRFIKGPK